jgi:hypothetical protein
MTTMAFKMLRDDELEFQGVLPLPDYMAPQDCRVCLQLRRQELAGGLHADGEYRMPVGTNVIALRCGYYAHADHSSQEVAIYNGYLYEREQYMERPRPHHGDCVGGCRYRGLSCACWCHAPEPAVMVAP